MNDHGGKQYFILGGGHQRPVHTRISTDKSAWTKSRRARSQLDHTFDYGVYIHWSCITMEACAHEELSSSGGYLVVLGGLLVGDMW